ncbi:MAG: IS30 family transposase [Fusobacteriaceae bacterium]
MSRELKRVKENYVGEKGQTLYEINRRKSLPKGKYNDKIAKQIKIHLNLTWSPEQISNTVLKNIISFKTIYLWIYKGLIESCSRKNLRHKGKRKKSSDKRGQFSKGKSIHERFQEVENQNVFGHWELDTVLSSRGENKEYFATFVERKTRFYIVAKMKDRTAKSMEKSIKYLCSIYPKKIFKSFTVDRGKEFSCYKKVEEELNIPVFFCRPTCSAAKR